jgi:hypothetical protein
VGRSLCDKWAEKSEVGRWGEKITEINLKEREKLR